MSDTHGLRFGTSQEGLRMSSTETPVDPRKAGRTATWLISAHVVFVLLFIAGGAISLWRFSQNGQSSVNCFGTGSSCGHHSYALGVTLLVVGFVGNFITIAIGARLAIGYGMGAFAHYQRRRFSSDSMTFGAQPGAGLPPDWIGGQPPGTPGSPSGPPL